MPDGEGEDVLLPKRKKPPDIWQITMIDAIIAAHNNATLAEECAAEIAANVAAAAATAAAAAAATTTMAKITDTQITMIGAARKATASAKAAADAGAATAAKMITIATRKTFRVDNVHIALKRTKYAAAAAANEVAAAGWNMRIGTDAYMPMDNNLNTIDAAVAAANIAAFALRTPLPPPPMRSQPPVGICESAPPVATLAFRKRTTYAVAAAANRVAAAGWNVRMREASLASTLDLGQRSAAAAANVAAVAAISKTASPLAANTLASDRQTMLISLRGDAPLCLGVGHWQPSCRTCPSA